MICFRKKALKIIKKYQEEFEFLHLFRQKQEKLHGEKFTESWISVAINFRISRILFKKSVLKNIFNI